MPSGLSAGREQRRMVLSNIQSLVIRAGLLAPDRRLDVFRLTECGLRDLSTLFELHQVSTIKPTGAELIVAEVCGFKERVPMAKEDLKVLHVARARVHELTVERALSTMRTERAGKCRA